ncbi:MAG: DUF488 family protein [Desulfurococcales archaeon]|nr:DUF488 family protein [Desulfurococcales archaeon]
MRAEPRGRVYTIGHSTRSLEELLGLLVERGVEVVVDVRRWPKSRRYPWFNREHLEEALRSAGIEYTWLGGPLGGRRRLGVDAPDTGGATCFESPGFRAYAIYLTTNPTAIQAMQELEALASRRLVAILCAERLPWRCHRKIIADWLALKGFEVIHIIDKHRETRHKPSKCATIRDGRVTYT